MTELSDTRHKLQEIAQKRDEVRNLLCLALSCLWAVTDLDRISIPPLAGGCAESQGAATVECVGAGCGAG